jgi:hypothetical protein
VLRKQQQQQLLSAQKQKKEQAMPAPLVQAGPVEALAQSGCSFSWTGQTALGACARATAAAALAAWAASVERLLLKLLLQMHATQYHPQPPLLLPQAAVKIWACVAEVMVMILKQCCERKRCQHGQQRAQAQTANRKTGGGQTRALPMLVVVVVVVVVHLSAVREAVVGALAAPITLHQQKQQ